MNSTKKTLLATAISAAAATVAAPAGAAQTTISGTGAGTAAAVDAFRSTLGTLNPNVGTPNDFGGVGRREINWDGVPDTVADPAAFPANFFNSNSPRGAVFKNTGDAFLVSADSSNPATRPVRYEGLDATYAGLFGTFSAQRLFSPTGSNELDVVFRLPGTDTPAVTTGFGAVFTDVDLAGETQLRFYDATDQLIGTLVVPATGDDGQTAFVGASDVASAQISRVRIKLGNRVLGGGPETATDDVVVLDDFLYGEPRPVPPAPTPTTPPATAPPVVTPTATTPPATKPLATVLAKVRALKVSGGRIRFQLDAAAAVRVVIDRRNRVGKYKKVKTIRRTLGAGAGSMKLPALVPGRYRATVTSVDAVGATISRKVKTFKVKAS